MGYDKKNKQEQMYKETIKTEQEQQQRQTQDL